MPTTVRVWDLPTRIFHWALAASVLGSVLAMVIAIQFGLNVTLACGAAAYLFALLVMPTLHAKSI